MMGALHVCHCMQVSFQVAIDFPHLHNVLCYKYCSLLFHFIQHVLTRDSATQKDVRYTISSCPLKAIEFLGNLTDMQETYFKQIIAQRRFL